MITNIPLDHQERMLRHLEKQERKMVPKPRIITQAADLHSSDRYCTCCHRSLAGKFAYLELDQRTNTYHDFGDVPEDQSQGWFPFGMTCARKLLAKAAKS